MEDYRVNADAKQYWSTVSALKLNWAEKLFFYGPFLFSHWYTSLRYSCRECAVLLSAFLFMAVPLTIGYLLQVYIVDEYRIVWIGRDADFSLGYGFCLFYYFAYRVWKRKRMGYSFFYFFTGRHYVDERYGPKTN